ncbi:FecCD family ABC transporter permease [Sulfurospirillum sp. 1612]|uniref:FecCD family ABC transporter permease n=1 Tax=Sulfurospirillum sp. 1612 TaxID=3094835 RepID=UPI002F92394C
MRQTQHLKKRIQKRIIGFVALLFLLLFFLLINLLTGSNGINFHDLNILFDSQNNLFITQLRLPRALGAILAGALLALSGAIMQGALKNQLASPFTLGISQAAAFGSSFAIIVLQAYSSDNTTISTLSVGFCAFLASMLCMLFIVLLSRVSSLSPNAMVLAGVALGSLFHSMTMFLQYFADDMEASATLFWTFGELGKVTWNHIIMMGIVFVPVYVYFAFSHWKMDALSFGDDSAMTRGVHVTRFRFGALLLSSLLSAVAVSFLGIIGFVGLVAPHITRMIFGANHFSILVFSSFIGAILLLSADFVSKIILMPIILPIGILTSFMGVPMFLYLLLRKGR